MTGTTTRTEVFTQEGMSDLEHILREGARRLLDQAIHDEVEEYIERHKDRRNAATPNDCRRRRSLARPSVGSGTLADHSFAS